MYPPAHICKAVASACDAFRLAWLGAPPESEDELNPGAFALIELKDIKRIGRMDDPNYVGRLWAAEPQMSDFGAAVMTKIYRGQIYAKDGTSRMDWDPLFKIPIIRQVFDSDMGFSHYDVSSGRILDVVRKHSIKNWLQDARRRDAIERGKVMESRVSDLTGEMGDYLWHEAMKADQGHVDMAKKHAKDNMPARYIARKEKGAYDFSDYYLERYGLK